MWNFAETAKKATASRLSLRPLTVTHTTRVLSEAAFKEMYRQGEGNIKTEIMSPVFDSQGTMQPTASDLQPVSVKVTAV